MVLVAHWRDFLCPFCYVGQTRSAYLRAQGAAVADLPFPIHPEIPRDGRPAPRRSGPMYEFLDREATDAGLPLRWPSHLPNTRFALTVAEWARRRHPTESLQLDARLFAAHFTEEEDIGDTGLVFALVEDVGLDVNALHTQIANGAAAVEMNESHQRGVVAGVTGTPAWQIGDDLVQGLQPYSAFRVPTTHATATTIDD